MEMGALSMCALVSIEVTPKALPAPIDCELASSLLAVGGVTVRDRASGRGRFDNPPFPKGRRFLPDFREFLGEFMLQAPFEQGSLHPRSRPRRPWELHELGVPCKNLVIAHAKTAKYSVSALGIRPGGRGLSEDTRSRRSWLDAGELKTRTHNPHKMERA